MAEFTNARGFQDAWQSRRVRPVGGGRDAPAQSPPVARLTVSAAQKARLARVVRRAPEVLVRVGRATTRARDGSLRPTSPAGEAARFGQRLTYITRNDRIALETSDGLLVCGREARAELEQEWVRDAADDRAAGWARDTTRLYKSVILSMPPGTDPVSVQDAARAFAAATFTEHKWIMALHTDTPHPHVHLDVQTVGADGYKLYPNRDELERYRDGFARELRRLGIEAEATPRHARGEPRRPEKPEITQMRRRSVTPEADERVQREVRADPARGAADRPGDVAAKDRRAGVIDTYLAAAAALRAGSPEDARLADQVVAFVASMPAYVTVRQEAAQHVLDGLDRAEARVEAEPPPEPATAPLRGAGRGILPGGDPVRLSEAFAVVYARPADASRAWERLVAEGGREEAINQVRISPDVLGKLQGWRVLGIDSGGRQAALDAVPGLLAALRAVPEAAREQVAPLVAQAAPEDGVPNTAALDAAQRALDARLDQIAHRHSAPSPLLEQPLHGHERGRDRDEPER